MSRRRGARVLLGLLALTALVVLAGCGSDAPHRAGTSATPSALATVRTLTPPPVTSAPRTAATSPTSPARAARDPKAVTTPQGLWWGVDSTQPISAAILRNVHDWYRGARPQLWGRYVDGSYAVSRAELAYARRAHLYVFLIVTDRNCSGCAGGDVCGNDRTSAQARSDAAHATAAARREGVARGALLLKDIEEVGGCSTGVTPAYLRSWYRAATGRGYRAGFYGNVHRQFFAFPRAYCSASRVDPAFRRGVVLDMNEDEPRIGAPRGSTGPHNAPRFAPKYPSCAAKSSVVIWQYGESLTSDNWTDIDQARPGIAGLLDPHGGVSRG